MLFRYDDSGCKDKCFFLINKGLNIFFNDKSHLIRTNICEKGRFFSSLQKINGMRILITGASGFIGGFLVEEALRRGYETWAGIRSGSNKEHLKDPRIRFIDLEYSNKTALTNQLKAFAHENGAWDYIIHNAGVTKTLNKEDFLRINSNYTHQFTEALAEAGCLPRKFVLMSSLSAFGKWDEKTFRPISLNDTPKPDTAYGYSKLQAEKSVKAQQNFPYIILRPTGVYGPGEKDYFMEIKSIQSGFDFATGFKPQRITFIYVKDLVTVTFLALEKEEIKNRSYFVADGDVYTDTEFARLIQNILGKKHVLHARIPLILVKTACFISELLSNITKKVTALNTDKYIILKQRNWICDVSPLQDELGFTPAYPLRKGLEECIKWYRNAGWL